MKRILGMTSVIALTALAAPAASAATIVIDDFSASGSVASKLNGNPATTDVSDTGILGGNRFMWVSTDNTTQDFGTTFSAGGGKLTYGNDSGATGQAVLVYDGGGAGTDFSFTFNDLPTGVSSNIAVDTDGLGGIDLDPANDPLVSAFTFSGSDFDVNGTADFWAYAWDTSGNLTTYFEEIQDVNFSESLFLAAFTEDSNNTSAFDWNNVGALAFSIEANTNNFDGTIDAITVVPLPASALLLLGGLGGLAGVSARRRRKA
ncbi:MAG: VPLPA-CTERM sorting domain-containing protein [Rhodovulum sp.]